MNIATERTTGLPISSGYSNAHMERGHEQEPIARMLYEEEVFCSIKNGGFFDCGNVGVSPDGLLASDGLIEIKSVIPNIHLSTVKRQSYDPAYRWQLIGNLYYSDREYIDFISYCADFPDGKRLFICTLQRDKLSQEFEMLVSRVGEFQKLINKYQSLINDSEYQVSI
jgi:hypothetical protein